jgi:tripartite ATP-independent transporter DctM subunit
LTVLLAVNLQTSFMHPRFGIALYNLRSVTPRRVKTADIYLGAVPFLLIQALMVATLIFVPAMVTRTATTPRDIRNIRIQIPLPDLHLSGCDERDASATILGG